MTETVRALLAGIVDYAGLFPPAALPVDEAVDNLRRYRIEPESWMLGRFVCPVARLGDLEQLGWGRRDGALAVLVPGGKTESESLQHLDEAQQAIQACSFARLVDTLEMQWPSELVDVRSFRRFLGRAGKRSSAPVPFWFFEFNSAAEIAGGVFAARLTSAAAALADFNSAANDAKARAGFKYRTGGTSAAPSADRLAAVIAECRDAGVYWKATGGLHHPWRHMELGTPAHGFLNILAAATLAYTEGLPAAVLADILDDDEPSHFCVDADGFHWHEHVLTPRQVAAARRESFRSFGSCSFEEPRQLLQDERLLCLAGDR
jgi:hypothetical protein